MLYFINQLIEYSSHHVILMNSAHFVLGFGIAVLVQQYVKGDSVVPMWIGWAGVLFGLIAHILAFIG